MTIMEMLGQSGVLTLLGMAIVFGFLFILVIAVTLTGKVIMALGLDKDPSTQPKSRGSGAGTDSGAVTAAITAAVKEYRSNN